MYQIVFDTLLSVSKFGNYFTKVTKENNLNETYCIQTLYLKASTGIKSLFLEKNVGTRLWIMKWTFKSNTNKSEKEQQK